MINKRHSHKIWKLIMGLVMTIVTIHPQGGLSRGIGSGNKNHSSVGVRGYSNKRGGYVQPHRRTPPNREKRNNWSTKGNVNPYTGKSGNKSP